MPNTEEWWSINSVSLHEYGWSVTTVGGSRYDIPPRRGSNITVGYRPGQVNRPKMPDARTISLVMFMVGWDPTTGPVAGPVPTSDSQRTQWNDNWDALRRMVFENYLNDGLVLITRRWRLTAPTFPTTRVGDGIIAGDPGTPTSGVSRLVTATGFGEIAGSMAPTMTGRTRSDFQIDMTMPDPYFYDSTTSTVTMARGQNVYVWNDGHDVAGHNNLTIDLVGPLTNPLIYNLTPNPDIHLSYFGTIPSGQIVTLNVGKFTAIEHAPSATTGINRIANMSNSGSRLWHVLLPGANKISLAADSGSDTPPFPGGTHMSNSLVFADFETIETLTTLDLATVAPSSSDDSTLTVFNTSDTYQAVDVVISLSGPDADQLWLSVASDVFSGGSGGGEVFSTQISVGNILPGGASLPFYLRRVTASTDSGSCNAVVTASPSSWSAPVDTSTTANVGLDQDTVLDYDPTADQV